MNTGGGILLDMAKRTAKGGRPPLPPEERRLMVSIRLPRTLLADLRRAVRGEPRGTATRLIEEALRRIVARRLGR